MTRDHPGSISRRRLVHAGLGVGLTTLLATAGTAGPAGAAATEDDPATDTPDLGLARVSASAELLAIAFYERAIASKKFDARETRQLRLALANDQEHYREISKMFAGTDQSPPTKDEFGIELPPEAFRTRAAIIALGARIEKAVIGIHLGSVAGHTAAEHRLTAARIAASDARHMALLSTWGSNQPIGLAFPNYLDPETAADVLSRYLV